MTPHPAVLCPVDFSEPSAGALRYAGAIAAHFQAQLVILTVEDPLLTEARDLGLGIVYAAEDSCRELVDFANRAFGPGRYAGVPFVYEVAVGKPAHGILETARERACDLIVVSTHGLTGLRKLFFGSTTERLLRSTTVPVLVTPAADPGPAQLEDVAGTVKRILVPVDLESDPARQVKIAAGVGRALRVPILLAHVLAPLRAPLHARTIVPGVEAKRRAAAGDRLTRLAGLAGDVACETVLVAGNPAAEIAGLARERDAGLIVVGLHGSGLLGPRMGSVTYRVLCLTESLVLAIPPIAVAATGGNSSKTTEAARP